MKKKIILLTSIASISCAALILFAAVGNGIEKFAVNADTVKSKIVLSNACGLTDDENKSKSFTRLTDGTNPIKFATFGGGSFVPADNNFARAGDNNGWFYNVDPLNGLETIDVYCTAGKAFRVYYFTEAVDEYRMNFVSFDDGVGVNDTTPAHFTIPKFENPVKYIVWQNQCGGNLWIKNITFNYTCSPTLENRGLTFNNKGQGFDIPEVDVATGTVNVDIKWTDLGADNGKTSVGLFSSDWSCSFGYKTVKATSNTGDLPGLTVIKLSDGYTRFSWKLSEMTNTSGNPTPTVVGLVHIRNDWTTSAGYFDCQTNAKVVEIYGERFVANHNFDFSYSDTTLADKKVELDILFDVNMTKDQTIHFYICNNNSTAYQYGNFGLKYNGLSDKYSGITFEKLSNGYCRFTFDINSLTKVGGSGAPTTSNYSYFRGAWTTASGYAALRII